MVLEGLKLAMASSAILSIRGSKSSHFIPYSSMVGISQILQS